CFAEPQRPTCGKVCSWCAVAEDCEDPSRRSCRAPGRVTARHAVLACRCVLPSRGVFAMPGQSSYLPSLAREIQHAPRYGRPGPADTLPDAEFRVLATECDT